jgi:hypothetical protein
MKKQGPKILLLDIETAPIIAYVWGLWDNNVALNQIKSDWYVLSWSAKWLHDNPSKIMYADQRNAKNIEDDSNILKKLWVLIDEADIIIGQNSTKFDLPKLNARFAINGMKPPSSYREIDTMRLAKKYFGFTSNKLEYMTDKLCVKYKKLKHKKFPGFEMWRECLAGNKEAWKAMEKYNKYDVLSLEELYLKLAPWDKSHHNLNVYNDKITDSCNACGGTHFTKNGYRYTNAGKFQRLVCTHCGAETRLRINELSKEKKKSLRS